MVGTEDAVWFRARPEGAARDLFEVFAQRLASLAAEAAAFRDAGHDAGHDTTRALRVTRARAQLTAAQRGDWQPFVHYLRGLGTAYAHDDVVASAWSAIADRFYAEIAPRLVEAYASEPARLTQVLLVLGDFMGRARTEIAGAYNEAKARLVIDHAARVAHLEQRVAERTAALETANRELEVFSYSASHDLRTPLRAIDGFSRMLLADYEGKLDDRAQHYLQRIRAGTQRMSMLIDDLLSLARIRRVPLQVTDLDLSAIAFEVASDLRKREPTRLTPVHIAPGLRARGDAQLIRIVLENLLDNAWKFTAKSPAAEIWLAGDGATFVVRDTGAGFDMAYAEKLFRPFQRLHGAHEFEGIGVGLATVQRIVHHHGGRIWAEGAVDKGAAFFFTLGTQGTLGDHA